MILKFNKRIRYRTIGEKSRIIKPLWQCSGYLVSILNWSTNIESLRDSSKYTVTIKLESYFIEPLYTMINNKVMCMVTNQFFRMRGSRVILGMKELYSKR